MGIFGIIGLIICIIVLFIIFYTPKNQKKDIIDNSKSILYCSDNLNSYTPIVDVFRQLEEYDCDIVFLGGLNE